MTDIHYIYLLQEREFFVSKVNVYKIGKTTQEPTKRFAGYPKGTVIISVINVISSSDSELFLLDIFRKKFIPRTDYGNEHFQGDLSEMLKVIQKHHMEQIKLTKLEAIESPVVAKYENTLIEFLETRTLPVLFGDSREPISLKEVTFQQLSQFYRQWCKDNRKKVLLGTEVIKTYIDKFLELWIHHGAAKKSKGLVCVNYYAIFIYKEDPKLEKGHALTYRPKSWAWHYTSRIDEIDETRTPQSPKTGLHLKDSSVLVYDLFDSRTTDDKLHGELKYFDRLGWTLYIVIYETTGHQGLLSVRPGGKLFGERVAPKATINWIRNFVKERGGFIRKTWLSEGGQFVGIIVLFGKEEAFIPCLDFAPNDDFKKEVEEIANIWSGIILFPILTFLDCGIFKGVKSIDSLWFDDYIYDISFRENTIIFDEESKKWLRFKS